MPKPKKFTKEEWIEAGIAADESLGRPAKRKPEEGIAEMKKRITHLKKQEKRIRESNRIADEVARDKSSIEIAREISDARKRLSEYEAQHKGRN
ncbi:MAG TPA: hypothetical protein VGH42_13520 [Verrucomicrobiae bacterium]|jgi:hypothetical protein